MLFKAFIVDAFTTVKFAGNQAAVCLIDQELAYDDYQNIAREFNLSETAFPIPIDGSWKTAKKFKLRWLTPTTEVNLCGHATLATAHVLFREVKNENGTLTFSTLSGDLIVVNSGDNLVMNFPQFKTLTLFGSKKLANPKLYQNEPEKDFIDNFIDILIPKIVPQKVCLAEEGKKLMIVLDPRTTREELLSVVPDGNALMKAHDGSVVRGIILTLAPEDAAAQGFTDAEGRSYDYVSRYFAPWAGILEDPATGSSQCALGPFWSKEKNVKTKFYAYQCYPKRGAQFYVSFPNDDRIDIEGSAVTVIRGEIEL
uniref:Uncharacterized protein n=1 Tax=Panagrolaimus sp. JU765 TaxID=591449 RepID=A0AC34Q5P8_9BILA